ncbi:MAG: hypothetical protein Q7S66_01610 [bacterium]|nr:hypothetical protein [bacterium]
MYLSWDEKIITDWSDANINTLYDQGYIFTRVGRGAMNQTRSVRVDLSKFELSSENRRILKKTEEIKLNTSPLPYANYDWSIAKLGKDFYATKFGEKTFSANKIKELLTNEKTSNFNLLFTYSVIPAKAGIQAYGYTICCETAGLLHYCYPFYDLNQSPKDMGLAMMLRAIIWAKEQNKKYIYLGSFSRPTDTYKLQFFGLEWFDGKSWQMDTAVLKNISKKL